MQPKKKKRNNGDTLDALYRKRDRALDRVVSLWKKSGSSVKNDDELYKAVDALTLAHAAATFKFVGG